MGLIQRPEPVVRIAAVFSRHDAAFEWAGQRLTQRWGELFCETVEFPFEQTGYYTATMGPGLRKKFYAFRAPFDPAGLAADKIAANDWEAEFAEAYRARGPEYPEPRPLNIDSGYVTLAKLVLASTKNFSHRIYVGDGIFAEITLAFHHRRWEPFPWTFPDYATPTYHPFLNRCRRLIYQRREDGIWSRGPAANETNDTDETTR